jgi:hypothetical protein
MEMTERQMEAAAAQYAVANSEPVSTLTHSTAYVAQHFIEWRAKQKPRVEINHDMMAHLANSSKGTTKRASKPAGLRAKAFAAFADGVLSVKEVSALLSITYANAHYYKRAFNKQSSYTA